MAMSEVLTFDVLRAMICDLAGVMHAHAAELTRLDTAIGDGDHGRNMALGFQSVREEVLAAPPTTPAILFRSAGMTLVATVGGASGPLYSAAFIAAGIAARANDTLTLADLARMIQAASDAVARRGRCRLGDKTILDALDPAARALVEAAAADQRLAAGLQAAAAAAREGMKATIPLVARCGLALQFGASSAGHQDPGATSCYLIFDSFARTYRRLRPQGR
jgi:dihydroxyacetone kinase-like protein